MDNIRIIGTSHISKESIETIKKEIEDWKPDIVAIELDRKRLHSLLTNQKSRMNFSTVRKIGIKGALFMIIAGYIQKKLGRMVGVDPGSDMKAAYTIAKEHKIRVALIDQDIELTLAKFSKHLTWKERWNFVKSIVKRDNETTELAKKFDLRKVPDAETIRAAMRIMQKTYPGIYKVLVEERNQIMARNLENISRMQDGAKILAVVGAGHKEGMEKILNPNSVNFSVEL